MKKIIKIFVSLIICILLCIICGVLLMQKSPKIEIKRPNTENKALMTAQRTVEDTAYYYIEIEKLASQTFMDQKVNEYVDSIILNFKEENSLEVKAQYKAVLTNNIDSFKVTDEIYGIRVTSMMKRSNSTEYDTLIKTFNYTKNCENEITLNALFKKGYESIISKELDKEFLLKEKSIMFYDGEITSQISYNSLKEYAKPNIFGASNLEITEEEYDNLFSNVVDPNRKMVAITFDDGPHNVNTYKILDLLEENNARATFFMLGQNVSANPDVVRKVYDNGNEIGIHTWDHPQLTKLSVENITKQIQSTSDVIYNITGYRPKLVRPPYGAINDKVKSTLSDYSLILWNIDSLDWKSRDENKIVPLVMGEVQDGDIILLHDIHSTTVPAAQKIISQLVEQDYQLVTVSELLEAKEYDLTKTQIFYSGRQ